MSITVFIQHSNDKMIGVQYSVFGGMSKRSTCRSSFCTRSKSASSASWNCSISARCRRRSNPVACSAAVNEHVFVSEMDMGWVNPWVGLGWVGLGPNFSVCNGLNPATKIGVFYSHVIGVFIIIIILIYWNFKQTQPRMWLFHVEYTDVNFSVTVYGYDVCCL